MQTIIGSGGGAGNEIAKELINYTKDIRLVSRNPKKVNESDSLMQADMTNPDQLDKAVEGSDIVYITIGFEYSTKIWRETWSPFMSNLINSAKKHNSKVVFIDNIYMYDMDHLSNMTEETPVNPKFEKGMIRAEIFRMLMNAAERNEISALVARSADFYGPGVNGSYLTQTVYNNLIKDNNPQWLGKLDVIHSFTYTKDLGKAVAFLGNTPDAFNQVWHLPTTDKKITSRQWIELFLKEMNKNKKIQAFPLWAMGLMGIFVPILKELKQISYQLDRDYYFNSSKFNKRFNFTPISPEVGVREVINETMGQ